jgi:hypothetical protein
VYPRRLDGGRGGLLLAAQSVEFRFQFGKALLGLLTQEAFLFGVFASCFRRDAPTGVYSPPLGRHLWQLTKRMWWCWARDQAVMWLLSAQGNSPKSMAAALSVSNASI